MSEQYIDIVFQRNVVGTMPPEYTFVEVENEQGQSIEAGDWILNGDDGFDRLRLKVKPGLNNLARKINQISTQHGFWPAEGRNMGEMLMLAVSELSEALEEHRSGNPTVYYQINPDAMKSYPNEARPLMQRLRDVMDINQLAAPGEPYETLTEDEHEKLAEYGVAKPEGLAIELIDCIIRCLDTLQSLKVDIDRLTNIKMAYNASRPFKHGRAY